MWPGHPPLLQQLPLLSVAPYPWRSTDRAGIRSPVSSFPLSEQEDLGLEGHACISGFSGFGPATLPHTSAYHSSTNLRIFSMKSSGMPSVSG